MLSVNSAHPVTQSLIIILHNNINSIGHAKQEEQLDHDHSQKTFYKKKLRIDA